MSVNKWRHVTLSDVVSLQRGHDLPEPERIAGDVPVMGSFGLTGWHNTAKCKGPGVTVGRSGASFGVVGYTQKPYWPLNTALYVTDFHGNDERYVYYLLKTIDFTAYNTGSAQPSLNRNHLVNIPINLPEPTEQRAIAAVLGALDDKIEQNRRTGRGLEALARATFKAWFVDFEPVKAKSAGQTSFPGMPPAAFAALPEGLTDSSLGPVPQGWEVVDIYQLANVVYGAPFASKLFNETGDGKPLIRIRDLQTHSPSVSTSEQHPKGTLIQPGEIVVGMDGEFRLHYWTGPQAWLNQRLCSFKPLPSVPTMYLGEALRGPLDYVERSEAATTVIHLGKYDIDRFELLRPDKVTLAAFDRITSPMLSLIVQTAAESSKLAGLRDYLLPRLLSGRVRVSNAERVTREAP